jgi:hypothetical protein
MVKTGLKNKNGLGRIWRLCASIVVLRRWFGHSAQCPPSPAALRACRDRLLQNKSFTIWRSGNSGRKPTDGLTQVMVGTIEPGHATGRPLADFSIATGVQLYIERTNEKFHHRQLSDYSRSSGRGKTGHSYHQRVVGVPTGCANKTFLSPAMPSFFFFFFFFWASSALDYAVVRITLFSK